MFVTAILLAGCNSGKATVYITREISPESLVNIYKALGVPAKGRVAVKVSTGMIINHSK